MIVCVTGAPRCGSSLVMRMLEAGGIRPYAENRVSFEHSDVLRLPTHTSWLDSARGLAVKILDPLQYTPPIRDDWRFILMSRDAHQQARSQVKFMRTFGVPLKSGSRKALEQSIRVERPDVLTLLRSRGPVYELSFEFVLSDPLYASTLIADFLQTDLELSAMARVVVPRSPLCYPGLLELNYIADGVAS